MIHKKKLWVTTGVFASVSIVGIFGLFAFDKNKKEDADLLSSILTTQSYSLSDLAKAMSYEETEYSLMKNQAFVDEFIYQEVEKDLLRPISNHFIGGKKKSFQEFFNSDGAKIIGMELNPQLLIDDRDGIKRYKWVSEYNVLNASGFDEYSQLFTRVEDFRFDIQSFYIDIKDRAAKDAKASKMLLKGFMDLRGFSYSGVRRHDLGRVEISVTKNSDKWKIDQIIFHDFITLASTRPTGFNQITKSAFVGDGPSVHLRREAIRRGGYALSLTDINRDGFIDMYVGSAKESEVWMFDSKVLKYVKSVRPELADETMVKTGIFNDFDNDKDEDLFVTTFNPLRDENGNTEDLILYKNDNGKLAKVGYPSKGMTKLNTYYPMPAAVGDFNGDGLFDIYVGFPGKKDFTFTNLTGHEVNGDKSVQGMFLNKGNLTFTEQKMKIPTMAEGSRQSLFPHSSLAVDWNKDKNIDIVVIDDQDNLSPFYLNKGNAQFHQVAESIGTRDTSNAMSVAAGDFNNDGLVDFALTSVSINAANRFENGMIAHFQSVDDHLSTGISGKGIRLFQQAQNGTFTDITKAAGLEYSGEGSAGVEFLDYNNDGLLDIYLTNGLWSGNDRAQDAGHLLLKYKKYSEDGSGVLKERSRTAMSSFMSMLVDFRGDLFSPDLKGKNSLSVGGYQRNRLFRNNGDGSFVDVSFMEGVDSISDGYIVALADLDKDGKTDIVLRNGDPGQEDYKFPAVEVFHNQMKWKGSSIDIALKNTRGVDAIGVGVTVEHKGTQQYRQLIANNGPAQSERILHFGIGANQAVDKLTIHWASGDKVYKNVKAGRHEYSEVSSMIGQN